MLNIPLVPFDQRMIKGFGILVHSWWKIKLTRITGSPRFTTIHLMTIQSYDGTEKNDLVFMLRTVV